MKKNNFKKGTFAFMLVIMSIVYVHNETMAQSVKSGTPIPIEVSIKDIKTPKWSSENGQLAFTVGSNDAIYLYNSISKETTLLVRESGIGYGYQWSPDGDFILGRVTKTENRRNSFAVQIINTRTKEAKLLTDFIPSMPALPVVLGENILYKNKNQYITLQKVIPRPQPEMIETVLNYENNELKLYSLNGIKIIRPPFEEPLLNEVLSPDARYAAFEVYGGNLYVMNVETQELTDLGKGNRPGFSPDSKFVVFMRAEDNGVDFIQSDIIASSIDGKSSYNLTSGFAPLAMNPSWSPDGKTIAFDSPNAGKIYLMPVEISAN